MKSGTIMNPIVKVIGSREINQGQSVILRSSATSPNGAKLSYYWSCTGGTISDVTAASPKYTAHTGPNILKNNVCTLVVKDSNGGMATKTVSIRVR
jgi:hypothetical protein